jgi:hypothetical protein
MECKMPKSPNQNDRHKMVAGLPEFDRAMKHLVKVPKETVERREDKARTPRTPERKQ